VTAGIICSRFGIAHSRVKYTNGMGERDVKPVEDGTEADFRELLDFACTTTVKPTSPRAPKGKPETSSAPKAE
jgi:hypothetical protein